MLARLSELAGMLAKKPPKLYDPSCYPLSGAIKKFQEMQRKEGFAGAYNKVRMESTLRRGTFVGTDRNGNKYYENLDMPYGRTRWVEYPTPDGTWAIETKFDGTMVSPEWYGWLHYTHDKPGPQVTKEYEKPFRQDHEICTTMQRPQYQRIGGEPREALYHMPPGQWANTKPRGKIGNKYESWYQPEKPLLRNYADNSQTLHIE